MTPPHSERGSVTAELALALPSVALVIAVTLGGFGLQIERMKLVAISATAARALGRGEVESEVVSQVAQADPIALLRVSHLEDFVCAEVTRSFKLLGVQNFEVGERQCFRKMGL